MTMIKIIPDMISDEKSTLMQKKQQCSQSADQQPAESQATCSRDTALEGGESRRQEDTLC